MLKTLLLIMLFPVVAQAFINVEAVRKRPGEGFFGETSLRLAGQSGNTNKLNSQAGSLNIVRGVRDEFLSFANFAYGRSREVEDTNNGQLHLRQTFNNVEPRSLEIFTQIEFDEFKELHSRKLAGANLRHRVMETDETSVYAGLGAFYEIEDYSSAPLRQGGRGNIYLSFAERLNESATGSGTLYYQPSLRDSGDYRVRFQSGLDITMSKALLFNVQFSLSHDNWTPVEVVKTDTSYLAGLTLKY